MEDSRTQAALLCHLLEGAGYAVRSVKNGRDALEALRERKPGLIISDIMMPGMDGYELCKTIKSDPVLSDIPVILLTSLTDPVDIIRGLNAQADYYFTKPYDQQFLLSRVETLLVELSGASEGASEGASNGASEGASEGELAVTLNGERYVIQSGRQQMLNLLMSTYESAIQQNRKLLEAQIELKGLYTKLSRDHNLLRTLLDVLPERIYVKDSDGSYVADNIAHSRLLGCESPEEVVGKTVFDYFPKGPETEFESEDREVIQSGEPLFDQEHISVDGTGQQSWSLTTKMPFRDSNGRIIGLVCTSHDITQRKLQEEQLAHYAEELDQKNKQMEEDLETARELQQALLPERIFHFPRDVAPEKSAIHFCYHYHPAAIIGGDFFQVLALSPKETGIFLGDVMGHGIRPALVTAILRGLIEELRPVARDPGEFMSKINRGLSGILHQSSTPIFASAFYFVADLEAGELRFVNAGHPNPLFLRPSGNLLYPLRQESGVERGKVIGMFEDAEYTTSRAELKVGDELVLFTDGLFEVDGPHNDFFDEQRLMEAVRNRIRLPLPVLFDELLAEIQEFSVSGQFNDDMCLIGMEVGRLA